MKYWASLIALAAVPLAAQTPSPLLDAARRDLLHEALSGEVAKDHDIQISRHHRVQGSRGYRDAAQYVLGQLRAYGFGPAQAWIESFPSDGQATYQTWQSPSGWDVTWAELRMVEPVDERLVGYPEIAMSLMTYSNAGSATGELVWVGEGTSDADYAGKDVKGKFVLATGYGGAVHRLAVLKYGAAAVICYLDDERALEFPDMVQYTGLWPRSDELSRTTFGFNLAKRQGERLRALLASGQRVVVRGTVRGTGLEPFFMDVVVATIPGADSAAGELDFSAHLDHPKEAANDNASGSAALLDIARTLHELVADGRLPQPRRTIRLLWVPEWNGTMAYIDRHAELAGPALGGRVLANLNLDMVGENEELLHSRMTFSRTPASTPSALNDVVANLADMVAGMEIRTARGSRSTFNFRVTPYSGGSDHMMFLDRRVPAMMIGHDPDYTHHTSEDTPDKVDPVELERAEVIGAGAMLYLSDLTPAQAVDLTAVVAANGAGRLGIAAREAQARMLGAAGVAREHALFEARNAVSMAGAWEREAVRSVLDFNGAPSVRSVVEGAQRRLMEQQDALLTDLTAAARLAGLGTGGVALRPDTVDNRVPVRLTRGPLDFGLPASRLAAAAAWYATPEAAQLDGDMRFELVNLVDGRRTVSEIRNVLAAEFRPVATRIVTRYLSDLVTVGVARWK